MQTKINEGFVLHDILKRPWIIGKPVAKGGFGLIYLSRIFNF